MAWWDDLSVAIYYVNEVLCNIPILSYILVAAPGRFESLLQIHLNTIFLFVLLFSLLHLGDSGGLNNHVHVVHRFSLSVHCVR